MSRCTQGVAPTNSCKNFAAEIAPTHKPVDQHAERSALPKQFELDRSGRAGAIEKMRHYSEP